VTDPAAVDEVLDADFAVLVAAAVNEVLDADFAVLVAAAVNEVPATDVKVVLDADVELVDELDFGTESIASSETSIPVLVTKMSETNVRNTSKSPTVAKEKTRSTKPVPVRPGTSLPDSSWVRKRS
jgi:hypothetical protein